LSTAPPQARTWIAPKRQWRGVAPARFYCWRLRAGHTSRSGEGRGRWLLSIPLWAPAASARYAALQALLQQDGGKPLVAAANSATNLAVANTRLLAAMPSIDAAFPATSLGSQMKQVAQLVKLNQSTLGLSRQLFFCSLGGFDTHNTQAATHPVLLAQLGDALAAFYAATEELGVADAVTTFTLSDFARTFQGNGNGGTDHAWGGHHFVMGGAVQGGDFYGRYPTLALNGPDDTDAGSSARGRWIPTVAVDQYAATLASWYGVVDADLPAVFPGLNRFDDRRLAFL
jgi:uncharacterized protein (DUF1501 family)